MKKPKSFTLIELLVVIAIIGILVTLLLPSLSKARQKAKLSVCISNVKQMSTAVTLYTSDDEDRFPYVGTATQPGRRWLGKLGTQNNYKVDVTGRPLNIYLGADEDGMEVPVAKCPSTPHTDEYNYTMKGTDYFGNDYNAWPSLRGKRVNEITEPSRVVVFAPDGAYGIAMGNDPIWYNPFHEPNKFKYPYGFVDGSVRLYIASEKEGNTYDGGKFLFHLDFMQ